ncbi:transglycosylase domain-containing protein [Brachybacterium sp. EF45031]|uniref:transglycosylase domain-containing protein n=1 Tax=Brachybacterium sillae TaxID=2810536 RepID=UPI00217E2891|nr:transglycosylase domain-containing protein [Brachybacterium sillae]MCS6712128.1 transglycosylase domain-containing protein [Brachybacterium sillae]
MASSAPSAPAPERPAPRPRRSLPAAIGQTVALLLGMVAVSGVAGVLMAAFFLPAVTMTSAMARDGVDLLDSYPAELEVLPLNEASRIEAADGSLLAVFYTENRIMVPLEEISPHMQHAVVAIEDRRFYEHGGIDVRGMTRALVNNAAGGSTQGASTLTQQYVKNALLMDAVQRGDETAIKEATEQSYGRKLREAKLAISLEKKWSKDEILNAYLNVAQFGPSQYGVETAARHYFSKNAKDLNPGEAALLAGVTNGPNQYDPVKHPERGQKRRNEVLREMQRMEYISAEEYEQYSKQPVEDMLKVQTVRAGCQDAGRNGFFCDYVTRTLLNDPAFAPTYEERRKLLYGGGLTIRTTLDVTKQQIAADILERKVPAGSSEGFGHSIVTVEPGSGRILTMAQNSTFNPHAEVQAGETAINYNVPKALGGGSGFPVGSTFKPFTLVQWLASGRSIYDTVGTERQTITHFPAKCLDSGAWSEQAGYNPDNAVSVTLQPQETVLNSTKFSVNTSYANMARQLDLCDIADRARSMGAIPATLNPLDPATAKLSTRDMYGTELAPAVVVLGELRISALDMAAAYATFAAGGRYCHPTAIAEVVDRNGKPMPTTGPKCEQVLDRNVSNAVQWVLKQDLEDPRATGKGMVIPGHDAGGKTGTSGQQFHTWYVGMTGQMSTAVWFGHPNANIRPGGFMVDGRMLRPGKVWGNTVSLPTWQEYMTRASEGMENRPFPGPPAPRTGGPQQPGAAQTGRVPDVTGMDAAGARATLESAGYKVEEQRVRGNGIPRGNVVGTEPAAGAELPPAALVRIRVSDGS